MQSRRAGIILRSNSCVHSFFLNTFSKKYNENERSQNSRMDNASTPCDHCQSFRIITKHKNAKRLAFLKQDLVEARRW